MALVQETVVNQIEILPNNDVQVRFEIRVRNGENVLSSRWHRTNFDRALPNSVTLQMYEVNTHLVSMGEKPVSQEDIDRIKKFADVAWSI